MEKELNITYLSIDGENTSVNVLLETEGYRRDIVVRYSGENRLYYNGIPCHDYNAVEDFPLTPAIKEFIANNKEIVAIGDKKYYWKGIKEDCPHIIEALRNLPEMERGLFINQADLPVWRLYFLRWEEYRGLCKDYGGLFHRIIADNAFTEIISENIFAIFTTVKEMAITLDKNVKSEDDFWITYPVSIFPYGYVFASSYGVKDIFVWCKKGVAVFASPDSHISGMCREILSNRSKEVTSSYEGLPVNHQKSKNPPENVEMECIENKL
jgi:hypothetical protein